jgi:DNA-directed RNA polymerase subunit RPC12/RpoP
MSDQHSSRKSNKPGEAVDDGKGRIFPCENCGADLEFNIGQQDLKCPYCGHEKLIELAPDAEISEQDFHAILAKVREWRSNSADNSTTGQSEVRCVGCGGNVVFVGSLTSSECPYCGSPIQRDKVHDSPKRIPVHGVLAFIIEKDKARQNLTSWVKSRWFAPSEFALRGVEGRFNGVYLPFWTYDSMTFSHYSGERGEHYYVTVTDSNNQTRQEQRTRWWPVSGSHQRFFDDVLILASKGMRRDMLQALEPWPLENLQPFSQELLAGFLARTYEVELDEGFPMAKEIMDAGIASDVRGLIGGDEQRVHKITTRYDAITFKHLLLPVWLLAYRYHDKTYQVFINAVTGEVQGERPYSFWKIFLTILLVIGAVGAVIGISQLMK